MDWNQRFRQAPDLDVSEVTDGYLVQQGGLDRLHCLNPAAALVFESCDGELPAADLPDLVAAAFGLAAPPKEDVEACLKRFLQEGLVVAA